MYAVDVSPDLISTVEASEWGQRFPTIGKAWRRVSTAVVPFFAFPSLALRTSEPQNPQTPEPQNRRTPEPQNE